HRRGVIHRDIKPENILLSNGVPIVADFGIARVVESAGGKGMTGTGMSIGTPSYMSPEQAAADPATDARTDIYALGAVLFEMLAGEPPFGGGTSVSIMKKLFTEAPRALTSLRDDVPEFVARAVEQALKKEPEERFATAADFVAALRQARQAIATTPYDASSQSGKQGSGATVPMTQGIPSVAVLPLTNVGNKAELDYFSDGMTEELISTLARLPGVRVASRTSSFAFQGRDATIGEIGKTLNVQYVLEGSVRHFGTRVRVAAQLVDVATQQPIWSDRFDRDLDDVFALQDELATTIADALSVRLTTSQGEKITGVRRGTDDLAAYQAVLRGRYFWNQRVLDKAMESFQEAVKLDPSYAQAWAGLSDGFSFLAYYGAIPPRVAFERGRVAAERAISIDPQLPDAHYSRGLFEFMFGQNEDLAERAFQRAVELGPRTASSHATYCQWLSLHRTREQSHAEAAIALALDPLSPLVAGTVGRAALMSDEPDRAKRFAYQGLELAPDYLPCLFTLGGAYLVEGDLDEALAWYGKAVEKSRRLPLMVALHAHAAALAGDTATAVAALKEVSERPDGPRPGIAAWIYLGLGDVDSAIPLLATALKEHEPHGLKPLVNPRAGHLAVRDPRYAALVQELGLGDLHRRRLAILD
ncbi:MAG: protein kinase, partial [Gemmatimonadaceae bacterium]|nr:protein kinase [Gemmatimonadaceae bacterium]